jgi:dUTP pyrophosphatase
MSLFVDTASFLSKKYPSYMHLQIFLDSSDNELRELYVKAISKHNSLVLDPDNHYVDAGFDLYSPCEVNCLNMQPNKIDFQVVCAAVMNNGVSVNTGYYMYPRSSISGTPLRLANSVGIIDSGYRGKLIGKFDCLRNNYTVNKFDRLMQICAPGLVPIYVELVDDVLVLGKTERGDGGFGSTGK